MSNRDKTRTVRFMLLGLGILAVLTLVITQGYQFAWGLRGMYYSNSEDGLGFPRGYSMGGGHMGGGPYAITNGSTGYMGEMHRYVMGGYSEEGAEPELTKEEANQIAQAYLGGNLPGATALETSLDYPYMFVVVKGDVAVGMLMVDGVDGDVWYHEWGSDASSMMGGCW